MNQWLNFKNNDDLLMRPKLVLGLFLYFYLIFSFCVGFIWLLLAYYFKVWEEFVSFLCTFGRKMLAKHSKKAFIYSINYVNWEQSLPRHFYFSPKGLKSHQMVKVDKQKFWIWISLDVISLSPIKGKWIQMNRHIQYNVPLDFHAVASKLGFSCGLLKFGCHSAGHSLCAEDGQWLF